MKSEQRQFRISDLLLLTLVVALEVAAFVRNNAVAAALFLTSTIIALAVIWRRELLRYIMLAAIVIVFATALAMEIAESYRKSLLPKSPTVGDGQR